MLLSEITVRKIEFRVFNMNRPRFRFSRRFHINQIRLIRTRLILVSKLRLFSTGVFVMNCVRFSWKSCSGISVSFVFFWISRMWISDFIRLLWYVILREACGEIPFHFRFFLFTPLSWFPFLLLFLG